MAPRSKVNKIPKCSLCDNTQCDGNCIVNVISLTVMITPMKLSGTSICTYTIACITCALGACIHTLRTLHYTTLLQTTPDYITFIHTCELQTTIRVCFWGLRVCCAVMQKDVYNITSVSPCLPACLFMAIMDRFAVHILVSYLVHGSLKPWSLNI